MAPEREKGIVLVIVLGFILLFVVVATSFILTSSSEIKMVRKQNDSTRAFYIAEAGLARARYDLNEDEDWTDGTINGFTYSMSDVDGEGFHLLVYDSSIKTSLGGEFTVRLKDIAGTEHEIWVKSKGSYNDATRTVKAKITSAQAFGGAANVTHAVSIEGELDIRGSAEINPSESVQSNVPLEFEDIFGVTKEEMESIAANDFPDTYYETPFLNNVATGLTWVSAPTGESRITTDDWTGDGILVIEGDVLITGGVFDGIIWVVGAVHISGNPVIIGGIFVESGDIVVDTVVTGNATINYSYDTIDDAFDVLNDMPGFVGYWQETSY